jgi:hypothetical protein
MAAIGVTRLSGRSEFGGGDSPWAALGGTTRTPPREPGPLAFEDRPFGGCASRMTRPIYRSKPILSFGRRGIGGQGKTSQKAPCCGTGSGAIDLWERPPIEHEKQPIGEAQGHKSDQTDQLPKTTKDPGTASLGRDRLRRQLPGQRSIRGTLFARRRAIGRLARYRVRVGPAHAGVCAACGAVVRGNSHVRSHVRLVRADTLRARDVVGGVKRVLLARRSPKDYPFNRSSAVGFSADALSKPARGPSFAGLPTIG